PEAACRRRTPEPARGGAAARKWQPAPRRGAAAAIAGGAARRLGVTRALGVRIGSGEAEDGEGRKARAGAKKHSRGHISWRPGRESGSAWTGQSIIIPYSDRAS